MVESKLVELAVAGSSPVGHPIFCNFEIESLVRDSGKKCGLVCMMTLKNGVHNEGDSSQTCHKPENFKLQL